MNRKPVVAWTLYDFANSTFFAVIPATVYAKYYALAVVGNTHGEGDLWWGLAITVSMAIVALLAPPLGSIADGTGVRKRLLFILTYLGVSATALMATVERGDRVWGWVLAVSANAAVEAAVVLYNAYLPELVPADRRGRLSAYGFAIGYLGSAIALGVALPFALAGNNAGAFLITAALFALFALPAFLYLPGDRPAALKVASAVRLGFARTRVTFRRILTLPSLRRFLLAYLFFADGINTVVYFSAVFAGHTLGFTTVEVIQVYVVVQLSALVGAWLWARPSDVRGPRFVLIVTLIEWCIVVGAVSAVQTKLQFFVVAILAGTALGAAQAASRALMASLVPRGQEGAMFGFYALCGKTAAIFGPMIFGLISRFSGGNQRLAILVIGSFFLVALVVLWGLDAGGPADAETRR